MIKSSRFWWLHGAILFAAVAGCKNCGSSGGGCGPGPNSSPYAGAPAGGPIGSASATMYGQGASQGFPTSSGSMPSNSGFPSSANPGYSMPGVSSSLSPGGLGGARP